MLKRSWYHILNLKSLGITIIFFSWVAQNFMFSNYESQKNDFIYHSSFISNEMSVLTPWIILFNSERLREAPSPEIISNSSVQILLRIKSILEIAELYYSPTLAENKLTAEKLTKMLDSVIEARTQGNMEKVVGITMLANIAFPQLDGVSRSAIIEKLQHISEMENTWRNIFLWLYITGSIIIAIAFSLYTKTSES